MTSLLSGMNRIGQSEGTNLPRARYSSLPCVNASIFRLFFKLFRASGAIVQTCASLFEISDQDRPGALGQ